MIELENYHNIQAICRDPRCSIYSAVHNQTLRKVRLQKVEVRTQAELARLEADYRRARKTSNRHVAKIYDLIKQGPFANKSVVLVYEDKAGICLKERLRKHKIPIDESLHIALQLSEALEDFHQNEMIHNGLRPDGIKIDSIDQNVSIADFTFLVKHNFDDRNANQPESLESILPYISPEQTGRMDRIVDYRTDFYSLGIILYECLTGSPPFAAGDSSKLFHEHLAKVPDRPSDIRPDTPQTVSDIVMKMLAKDPEDRYQSARGIRMDLEKSLTQWRASGTISAFSIGGSDRSDRLQFPKVLYGRKKAQETLMQAFDRVSEGDVAFIVVEGAAGIGKTALVKDFYRHLKNRPGYFVSGKFDQMKSNIPYASLVQAFDVLIRQILAERKEKITGWNKKILSVLGTSGQVIVEVIPDLELIIGKQSQLPELGPLETQNRFNYFFGKFIRVFADQEHPLTIFLDDLQWADSPSLKLMEVFLKAEAKYLLFLGAFRDDEVEQTHPLMRMVDEIRKTGTTIDTIRLGHLEANHVNQLISETLGCDPNWSKALARLCFAKAKGNPFFLKQYIHHLHQDKMIRFDRRQGIWEWDDQKIEQTGVTDDVVDLIIKKIHKLCGQTRHMLTIAACIGNRFDVNTLAAVLGKSPAETTEQIQEAVQEELILSKEDAFDFPKSQQNARKRPATVLCSDGARPQLISEGDACLSENLSYRFLHDRVWQTAYSIIDKEEIKEVHLRIGRLMLNNIARAEHEARVFDIVNQLNLGAELITDRKEKEALARLNLLAGQKAKASAAFGPGFVYLRAGIRLLGEKCWSEQYALTLALYTEAAEGAYLSGNFDRVDQLVEIVLKSATDLIEKVRVYEIRIKAFTMQNKLREALKIGLLVLKMLGIRLSEKPSKVHILVGLLRTKLALTGKRPKDLLSLPEMVDSYKQGAMRILSSIIPAAYFSLPKLVPLIIFKAVNLSVRYGNAPESAFFYASYELLLFSAVGKLQPGYQFDQLALDLIERFNTKKHTAKIHYVVSIIRHMKGPLRETLASLVTAYQIGLESGDMEYAGYAVSTYCRFSRVCGKGLAELEAEMTKYRRFMVQMPQNKVLRYLEMDHQAVLNLMGRNEKIFCLTGECYKEEEMMPIHLETKDESAIFYLHLNKLILCYRFDDYLEGVNNAVIAERHLEAVRSLPHVPLFYFYDSLNRLGFFSVATKYEKKRIFRKVVKNQKRMKKWSHQAPMNYLQKFRLVEAEHCRVLGKYLQAMENYDQAIALAREYGYIQDEALANELAAKFYMTLKKTTIATVYLRAAHERYQHWGAMAKVNQLENTYTKLLKDVGISPGTGDLQRDEVGNFGNPKEYGQDLASVIKAVKVIAQETDMGLLLDQLMTIVIENAGAEKGYLVLKKDGRLIIEARVSTDQSRLSNLPSPIETCDDLSLSTVRYVIRTGKHILLNDAVNNGRFQNDPHIVEKQVKSLLCMPIMDLGKITGALYLENLQVTNVFTPERVEILGTVAEILANARAKNRAEQHLHDYQDQLRTLSSQIVLSEAHERRRIAVDLHDRIGHALSNIMMKLGALRQSELLSNAKRPESSQALKLVSDICTLVEQSIEDTQSLTFEISPPILYDLGIEAALEWLVERVRNKYHLTIAFKSHDAPEFMDEDISVLLFRASRELLFNMVKHSKADSGFLSLQKINNTIEIVVSDDGVGFDHSKHRTEFDGRAGFGLFSIKERLAHQGGDLKIESAPGKGTTITMTVTINRTRTDLDRSVP